jgi:hypothetical protein
MGTRKLPTVYHRPQSCFPDWEQQLLSSKRPTSYISTYEASDGFRIGADRDVRLLTFLPVTETNDTKI